MSATRSVSIVEYVDQAYEDVCDTLSRSDGLQIGNKEFPGAAAVVGRLSRVSTFVARVPITHASVEWELRVLPVWAGHDPVTELLLVAPAGEAESERAHVVFEARALLDLLAHSIGRYQLPKSHPSPLS